jgi:hypothetical protein
MEKTKKKIASFYIFDYLLASNIAFWRLLLDSFQIETPQKIHLKFLNLKIWGNFASEKKAS